MGYTAGSFTTGQQPTTAQWNVLWSNDASFNDGTGIANNAIAAASLSTSALHLGSATVTSTVNHTTVETTIISKAVTIPSGGRDVVIMVTIPQLFSTVSADRTQIKIKDGSTILQQYYHVLATGTQPGATGLTIFAHVSAPSAGAKTYTVTGIRDIGSGSVSYYADAAGAQITMTVLAT